MIRIATATAALLLLAACNQPSPSPSQSPSASQSQSPSPSPSPSPAPAAPVASKTIPSAFQGLWMPTAADCAAGIADTRVTISADQLLFFESSGPVTSVDVASDNDITVHAVISGEGEGPNDHAFHFVLSDDGETLTDVGSNFARKKCPSN